jgi:hypothetical protein
MKGSVGTTVSASPRTSATELAILGAIWLALSIAIATGEFATPIVTTLAASTAHSSGLIAAAVLVCLLATVPSSLLVAGSARLCEAAELALEPKPVLPLRPVVVGASSGFAQRQRQAGGRGAPEVAIGRFGAAVFRQIPGDAAVRRVGDHFEFQVDGQWIPFDEPNRGGGDTALQVVRQPAESEFVAKVYTAVVTTPGDENEKPGCAILRPDQILPYLAGLPLRGLGELKADDSLSALVA